MTIDVHCHYTLTARRATLAQRFRFEPADRPEAPAWDSYVSPRALQRATWSIARRILGIPPRLAGDGLDAWLEQMHAAQLLAAGPLERIVLLAFDEYHDDDGRRPPPPVRRADRGGDIYTSNTLIRDLCRRHPERYLFGASVHPYRSDAIACVNEVFDAGACLLKWLPLHQNINAADPRTMAMLRRCAELGLPVLAHYGGEFTLATQHPEYQPVTGLLEVLRRLRQESRMPPVIVAHVSTPVSPLWDRRSPEILIEALAGEFADAPLYADISALTAWGKFFFLKPLARRQELHHKLLFGTDYPVPVADPALRWVVGPAYRAIRAEPSWPQRILKLCRHLGFNEIVFHHAAEILPNVDFFQQKPAGINTSADGA